MTGINTKTATYIACAVFVGLAIGFFVGRKKNEVNSASPSTTPNTGLASKYEQQQHPPSAAGSISSPLELALLKKQFRAHDYEVSSVGDAILISLSIKNVLDKDIRAIDGVLVFTDLLDNKVLSIKLALNDPLISGSGYNWEGGVDYNEFNLSHRIFRSSTPENLKVFFLPHKVLFSDGTIKEYE